MQLSYLLFLFSYVRSILVIRNLSPKFSFPIEYFLCRLSLLYKANALNKLRRNEHSTVFQNTRQKFALCNKTNILSRIIKISFMVQKSAQLVFLWPTYGREKNVSRTQDILWGHKISHYLCLDQVNIAILRLVRYNQLN